MGLIRNQVYGPPYRGFDKTAGLPFWTRGARPQGERHGWRESQICRNADWGHRRLERSEGKGHGWPAPATRTKSRAMDGPQPIPPSLYDTLKINLHRSNCQSTITAGQIGVTRATRTKCRARAMDGPQPIPPSLYDTLKINLHRSNCSISDNRGQIGVHKTAGLPFWTREAKPAGQGPWMARSQSHPRSTTH